MTDETISYVRALIIASLTECACRNPIYDTPEEIARKKELMEIAEAFCQGRYYVAERCE